MASWFERAFGAVADGLLIARDDVRAKLIDEGWFGRSVAERSDAGNLWGLADARIEPSHWFAQEPNQDQTQNNEHEIDR